MIYKKQEIVNEGAAGIGLLVAALSGAVAVVWASNHISTKFVTKKIKMVKELFQDLPNKESKYSAFRGFKISEVNPDTIIKNHDIDEKVARKLKYDPINICLMKTPNTDVAYYMYNSKDNSYEYAIIDKDFNNSNAKEFIEGAFESKMGIVGKSLKSFITKYKLNINLDGDETFKASRDIELGDSNTIKCSKKQEQEYAKQFDQLSDKLLNFIKRKFPNIDIDEYDDIERGKYIFGIDLYTYDDESDDKDIEEMNKKVKNAAKEFCKINKVDSSEYDGKIDENKNIFKISIGGDNYSFYEFVLKYKKIPSVVNECGMFNEAKFI